jgi:hypothetical protein
MGVRGRCPPDGSPTFLQGNMVGRPGYRGSPECDTPLGGCGVADAARSDRLSAHPALPSLNHSRLGSSFLLSWLTLPVKIHARTGEPTGGLGPTQWRGSRLASRRGPPLHHPHHPPRPTPTHPGSGSGWGACVCGMGGPAYRLAGCKMPGTATPIPRILCADRAAVTGSIPHID